MNAIETVQGYLALVASFSSDPTQYERFVHPAAEWIEYPNALTPAVRVGGWDEAMKGAEAGKRLLARQDFEVTGVLEAGSTLVVEAVWTGEVGVDAGRFHRGQRLRAHLCMLFEFQDGKIRRQKNYDAYEAF